MSEPQPEDPSSTALTDIERLLVVWDKLTTAGRADSAMTRLINKSIANLSLPRMHADAVVSFQSFSRLIEIRNNLRLRGITGTSLIPFMAEKFSQKLDAHSLWLTDETPKSALQLFEYLIHWTALNTMLENMYPIHTILSWIVNLKGIIALDVNALVALPVQSNVSPDSLRLIEIGAKLLETLPHQHRAKISQVVDSQIKALIASNAYTPGLNSEPGSASHAVLESNDSQINREPQTGNELTAMNSDHVNVRLAISHMRVRSRC